MSVCLQRCQNQEHILGQYLRVRHGDLQEPGVSCMAVLQGEDLRLHFLKIHKVLLTGMPQSLGDSATSKVDLALRL